MVNMGVTRLNHAVLYVSQLDRSVEFYTTVLGFRNLSTGGGMRGAALVSFRSVRQQAQSDCRPAMIASASCTLPRKIQYTATV